MASSAVALIPTIEHAATVTRPSRGRRSIFMTQALHSPRTSILVNHLRAIAALTRQGTWAGL